MARGRKAAPTPLKLLKGTQPCRVNKAEPSLAAGRPSPPDHLGDDVKAEWNRLCDQLGAMGVLNPSHGFALAVYCSAYSRLLAANSAIAAEGMFVESGGKTTTSPNGSVTESQPVIKTNPAVNVAARAESVMLRVLTEFGLTAASSSKVSVTRKEDDGFASFLNRKKS